MMYAETDLAEAKHAAAKRIRQMLIGLCPFVVLALVAFFLRHRLACTAAAIAGAFFGVFFGDIYVRPARKYIRFLQEILSGRSHETAGFLLPAREEIIEDDGVRLKELFINIYADRSEDGVRRFLLDARKPYPDALVGRIVLVQSHDTYVLGVRERGDQHE